MGLKDLFKPVIDESDDNIFNEKDNKVSKDIKNKTILIEPRAFSEAQQIADYLKGKNQVVVNFKRVTTDVSKRIMDFLHGIVYAIDGTMQKIGPGIIICAPKGSEIEGSISSDDVKKGGKSTGENEW